MQSQNPDNQFKSSVFVTLLKRLVPFLMALLTFLLVQYGSDHPGAVEKYYTHGVYPIIARFLSGISSQVKFSLWDISWVAFGLLVPLLLIVAFFRRGFFRPMLRLFQLLAVVYSLFYWVWGFNYFREPIQTRAGWDAIEIGETKFLAAFDTIIDRANRTRCDISSDDYPAVLKAVEASYSRHATELGLVWPNGVRRPKTMLFSPFFAKAGVSGYYGPLWSETHLNRNLLPSEYPFVLAHEMAHQFGITGEAEANWIAWYICSSSDDKRLQYAGHLNLVRYFLADALAAKNPERLLKRFDKKTLDDIRKQRSHWLALRNEMIDKAQTAANDAYLKSNKVEGGVQNYNKVVALTIQWLNQR